MIFQHELIKSLSANSNRIAIETDKRNIRYASLLNASNKVTETILKDCPAKETIVAIQVSDKPDLITAIIGVLNAGCVFVLINDSMPEKRREVIMKDLNPGICILSKNSTTLNKKEIEKG